MGLLWSFILQCIEKISLIAYYIPGLGLRNHIERNLKIINPALEDKDQKAGAKLCIASLGKYVSDFLRLLSTFNSSNLVVENPEILLRSSKPMVCLSGHFMGFDFSTLLPSQFPVRMLSLYDSDGMYHPLEKWICGFRERGGAKCVPSSKAYRTILKEMSTENSRRLVIGALADLEPAISSRLCPVYFFRKRIPFLSGIIQIGIRINAEFCYCSIRPLDRGKYSLKFNLLDITSRTSIKKITQAYATALEYDISLNPHLWIPILFRDLSKY